MFHFRLKSDGETEIPEVEPEVPEVEIDDDEGGLGRAGKVIIARAVVNAVDEKNNQPPPQEQVYYQDQHVVTQPPQYPGMAPAQYPPTGVVVNQPVAYAQGDWIRPDLCGLCCDGTCCYAAW